MEQVFQALQAGGNLALVAIAYAIWRIEARLIKVETTLDIHLKTKE